MRMIPTENADRQPDPIAVTARGRRKITWLESTILERPTGVPLYGTLPATGCEELRKRFESEFPGVEITPSDDPELKEAEDVRKRTRSR